VGRPDDQLDSNMHATGLDWALLALGLIRGGQAVRTYGARPAADQKKSYTLEMMDQRRLHADASCRPLGGRPTGGAAPGRQSGVLTPVDARFRSAATLP
jgi:hypothetical protein